MNLDSLKEKHLKSNFSLALLAVVISVFLWLFIALTQYPYAQRTIANIPVVTDISGTAASVNGLSVISCDVKEVTVELRGSRTQIGNLNNGNLEAYFDADSISTAGTKKLAMKIRTDSGIKFEEISVFPSTASIVFDKIDTREFEVTPDISNVKTIADMDINDEEISCLPSFVRITGPTSQLNLISKCKAVISKETTLDMSTVLNCDDVLLFTDDNAVIDQSSLKFNDKNVKISVPVRRQKEVRLTVPIIGVPSDFNRDTIKLTISEESAVLASDNSQAEFPSSLDVGFVSLSDLRPGFTKTFSLNARLENSDFINVSNIDKVTVSLNDDSLAQTDLVLDQSRITISNVPDNGNDYSVVTKRLNITVVGPEDVISKIVPEDIIADVNLLDSNMNTDQFNWNATFSCPNYDNVWVATSSKVSIKRTKKEPASESSD